MDENQITKLPLNFRQEIKALHKAGITSWEKLNDLEEKDLTNLIKNSNATPLNLKKLTGMASLICEINISQEEAALLIHSGLATSKALSELNPQELLNKTARLLRKLSPEIQPSLDLIKARLWIHKAKQRQILN